MTLCYCVSTWLSSSNVYGVLSLRHLKCWNLRWRFPWVKFSVTMRHQPLRLLMLERYLDKPKWRQKSNALLHFNHRPNCSNLWNLPWIFEVHSVQLEPTDLHFPPVGKTEDKAPFDLFFDSSKIEPNLRHSHQKMHWEQWTRRSREFPTWRRWWRTQWSVFTSSPRWTMGENWFI